MLASMLDERENPPSKTKPMNPGKEEFTSMKTKLRSRIERKRNIGIIAHVDAGKTTVSERILYYTGRIHEKGEVHTGNTTLDVDVREKNHGITIVSAATTVHWREHEINLIDTPGHVDFGIEVKRSLRVLDGAVVVFDAVAGVEPQTETNWRMADDFGVIRIAFINKMDRIGADFARTIEMMRERLGVVPLPVQLPVLDESRAFLGLIDLVTMRMIRWLDEDGKKFERITIPDDLLDLAEGARTYLIENAIEEDEQLFTAYLEKGTPPGEANLRRCIRLGTVRGHFVPVLAGTALKNRGMQPLLDAIVDYLPYPSEMEAAKDPEALVAYAFKTTHQGNFGSQTWLRIYSGTLAVGDRVRNTSRDVTERISRLVRLNSNDVKDVTLATTGDIVAVIGMKETLTGDTICGAATDGIVLERIDIPDPVTRVAIEAANREERDKLAIGLNRLIAEDPTLHLSTDEQTGQAILSGMGELHLEMAKEKLEGDLKIQIAFGRPQVAFLETIREVCEITYKHRKQGGGPGQFADVVIRFEPLPRGAGFEFVSVIGGGAIPKEYIPGVEKGIRSAMQNGTINGYPVVDLRAVLLDGETHPNDSSALAFEIAGAHAFREAMPEASPVLLEPVMKVQAVTPREFLGDVIGDLIRRRGVIQAQTERGNANEVEASVPLAELFGYIDTLRSLTSGRASFTMEFARYAETN